MVLLDPIVAGAFGVQRRVQRLVGDEGCTYRAGDVVLRQEADPAWADWLADLFSGIVGDGFRVARPLPTRSGGWMAPGGWYAWTFLEGRHAQGQDLPTVAPAISAFHVALAGQPWPARLRREESPFTRADRAAWGPVPTVAHPRLAGLLDRLAEVRQPLPGLAEQIIHGDLNPDNILVAPGLPPAFIDMAPYWRPAGFAAAVAAFWFGPYRADPAALVYFGYLPHFGQLLVRAATRMLLIKAEFGSFDDLDRYEVAVPIVCDYVGQEGSSQAIPYSRYPLG